MKRWLYLMLSSLSVIYLIGCRGEEPKRIPDTLPDVAGHITDISAVNNDQAHAIVEVRAIEGMEAKYDAATITIDNKTLIKTSGGKELKIEHLRKGQEIQAWFRGEVMESMPVQGYAKAVRTIEP
jgi:hypothetical protein